MARWRLLSPVTWTLATAVCKRDNFARKGLIDMTGRRMYDPSMLRRVGMMIVLLAFTLFTVAAVGHTPAMDHHAAMDHQAGPAGHPLAHEGDDCCTNEDLGAFQDGVCALVCIGLASVILSGPDLPVVLRNAAVFDDVIEVLPRGRSPDHTERPPKTLLL